jgi:hypothetical protein
MANNNTPCPSFLFLNLILFVYRLFIHRNSLHGKALNPFKIAETEQIEIENESKVRFGKIECVLMGSTTVQGIFSVIEALNLAIKLFSMERELRPM